MRGREKAPAPSNMTPTLNKKGQTAACRTSHEETLPLGDESYATSMNEGGESNA